MNKKISFFTGIFSMVAGGFLASCSLDAMLPPHENCRALYDTYKTLCQRTQNAKIWLLNHKKNNLLNYTSPEGSVYVYSYNRLASLCRFSQSDCRAFPHYLINSTMPGCVNSTIQIEHITNCDHPEHSAVSGSS